MNSQLQEYETEDKNDHQNNFQAEILEGLKNQPKKLSSKYFYDKKGDRLFQQIMMMPEYYLTKCELDIFKNKTHELEAAIVNDEPFDLIELGSGDALKSGFLLKYLAQKNIEFTYMPIDISGNILSVLDGKLKTDLPDLNIIPLEGEYFEMLEKATDISKKRKIVLFLGSNIGNMEPEEAYQFCSEVKRKLNPGDLFLIGFDLKKNPHTILNAYNDPAGITAAFNLNLLKRINEELHADFDIKNFQHYQTYDPVSGACRSYIVSLCKQKVSIGDETILFDKNELIDMEISQKFSENDIKKMAKETGFEIVNEIRDSKGWFVDSVWKVV